jgi:hypothetical protein
VLVAIGELERRGQLMLRELRRRTHRRRREYHGLDGNEPRFDDSHLQQWQRQYQQQYLFVFERLVLLVADRQLDRQRQRLQRELLRRCEWHQHDDYRFNRIGDRFDHRDLLEWHRFNEWQHMHDICCSLLRAGRDLDRRRQLLQRQLFWRSIGQQCHGHRLDDSAHWICNCFVLERHGQRVWWHVLELQHDVCGWTVARMGSELPPVHGYECFCIHRGADLRDCVRH